MTLDPEVCYIKIGTERRFAGLEADASSLADEMVCEFVVRFTFTVVTVLMEHLIRIAAN